MTKSEHNILTHDLSGEIVNLLLFLHRQRLNQFLTAPTNHYGCLDEDFSYSTKITYRVIYQSN